MAERDVVIREIRAVVIDAQFGGETGSDRLIRLGLDALLAGVDTPTLPLLAGLTRAEEPRARELFARVVDELGLLPALPAEPPARDRSLLRWWSRLLLDGDLDPGTAGSLIRACAERLGTPEDLWPLVQATHLYSDAADHGGRLDAPERDLAAEFAHALAALLTEAHHLLARG